MNHLRNLRVFDTPSEEQKVNAGLWGFAFRVMCLGPLDQARTPYSMRGMLDSAIRQKRIKAYFCEDGKPVGYVIWAYLAERSETRVRESGEFLLHEDEWNEGPNLWVVDLLAPCGHAKYIFRDLRDHVFKGRTSVRYLRGKNGYLWENALSRR